MNNDIAIKVQNLTKIYHLYEKPQDRLKEALNPFKKSYHHDFYAMNDVGFEIKKGETVGIVGKNGAGKSTLLKMITGVLTPTSGSISVNGKIASLLELGAGFNHEMSGLENIYLNGMLMGFTKEEMDAKVDIILEFADIGEFISQPVKMYSSGMFARLAFSVAINVEPDILIVDEALSVGDMRFQQKCIRKMEEFGTKGKTILFVTHDIGLINKFCSEAIWIEAGQLKAKGVTDKITNQYFLSMSYGDIDEIPKNENENEIVENEIDNIKWNKITTAGKLRQNTVTITDISLYSETNKCCKTVFSSGEDITIYIRYKIMKDVEYPILGFIIKDRLGMDITGANTILYSKTSDIGDFIVDSSKIIKFTFKMPYLMNGKYSIAPAIANGTENNHEQLHWVNDAVFFDIVSDNNYKNIGWYFGLEKVKIGESHL